jgi:hypothetical protein
VNDFLGCRLDVRVEVLALCGHRTSAIASAALASSPAYSLLSFSVLIDKVVVNQWKSYMNRSLLASASMTPRIAIPVRELY